MNTQLSSNPTTLTGKDLFAARFAANLPFKINLINNQTILIEKVIRLAPKRRLIAYGTWQGKSVVAKLFFKPEQAKLQMQRDILGVKLLEENNIKTPILYYQGTSEDKLIYVLLFERIFNAKNIEEIWQTTAQPEEIVPLLQSIMIKLADHHKKGIVQHDSNLRNYLITGETIYTIDGAEITIFKQGLAKINILNNLALFFSQFGIRMKNYHEQLFQYYTKVSNTLFNQEDFLVLSYMINRKTEKRWLRMQQKIFKECSNFLPIRSWKTFGMVNRNDASPEIMKFLNDPDSIFNHPTLKILNENQSESVLKVCLDNRELIVRCYQIKNKWHGLRQCLMHTPAYSSWQLALKLDSFGILTARPVAFVEKKYLGLRGMSYYMTEFVEGTNVRDFLTQHPMEEKVSALSKRIVLLMQDFAQLKLIFKNLKMSHIMLNVHGQLLITQLNNIKEYSSVNNFDKALQNGINAFLENSKNLPLFANRFKTEWCHLRKLNEN